METILLPFSMIRRVEKSNNLCCKCQLFLGESLKLYRLWGTSKSKAVPEITTNFMENKQGVHVNIVNSQ